MIIKDAKLPGLSVRDSHKSADRFYDIFFIYHPDDIDFVRRAAAQLQASDCDCYFDERISGKSTVDIAQVRSQLLRAHTVAVVLSPVSAESQLCNELIQYTVTNGKRLLTLIRDEQIEVEVHPAIAEHPFVFFRDEDEFVARIEELRGHLTLDRSVTLHSELLVAADRWQRGGRRPDLLLPSERNAEARAWLAEASTGEAKPSSLLVEFIHGSRRVQPTSGRPVSTWLAFGAAGVIAFIAAFFILQAIFESQAQARVAAEATSTAEAELALTSAVLTAASNSAVSVIDEIAATAEAVRLTALAQASEATALAAVTQTAQYELDLQATNARATQVFALERDAEGRRLLGEADSDSGMPAMHS